MAAVLVMVPLFVVPYSALPFEEAKVALLRTAALFVLPFFTLVLIRIARYPANASGLRKVPFQLLSALVLFFAYIHLASSFFSVSPEISMLGALLRRQGTYTTWCYLFFFFVAATILRTQRQIDRVLLSVQLTGFVVSFWAILQYLGLDPNLTHGFREPTWSTLGNQLFLPAFLIMCVSINLYYIVRAFQACFRVRDPAASVCIRMRQWIFFLLSILFLLLNLIAIVVAWERGPILGLVVGLFLFLVLYCLGIGYRKTAASLLGSGGFLAALVMIVGTVGHRIGFLANTPLMSALADSFHTGSGLVRFYIWKGIIDLVASQPARVLIGYGAETLPFVLPVHNYAILKQIESPTAVADRSHNEILDVLAMQGIFGAVIFLVIFGTIGYIALLQMGLIPSRRHWFAWVISLLSGVVLGGLAPCILTRETAWVGMGTGVGMVGGLFLYLCWYLLTINNGDHVQWNSRKLLLSLLLSALTAHFVEIQFSFGITATRLYFWVFSGMIVGMGYWGADKGGGGIDQRKDSCFILPPPAYPAILSGLAIITISFDYLCFSRNAPGFIFSVLICHIGTIASCWFFFQPATHDETGLARAFVQRRAAYFTIVLVVGIMYYLGYFVLEGLTARGLFRLFYNPVATVLEKNVNLSFYYGWMLVVILVGARLMLNREICGTGPREKSNTKWFNLLMALVVLMVLVPAIRFNVNYSMADIYTKAGDEFSRAGEWRTAVRCFSKAIALEPKQAWRHQKLGHLFFTHASKVAEPNKSRLYEEALLGVEKASLLSPLDVTLKNNLARMGATWTSDAGSEKTRFHRLKVTNAFYQSALAADPNNPLLWQEAGQISAALGNLGEAIKQFRWALDLQPDDYESHRNLALLHQALKQYPQARAHAWSALGLARAKEKAEIEGLIAELEKVIN